MVKDQKQMRHQKSARELRKEASKTYNIQALWKRNQDLGMLSTANAQTGLGQSTESLPNGTVCLLSEIPCGEPPPLSKQRIYRDKQVEALKELTRLMELVTEQEKKYEEGLSPHSHFYRRHLMVQQFLQTQLKTQPSQPRRNLSSTVSRAFGRGHPTARNIVQWEKSWVETRKIPKRKDRDDADSWMYDEDVNDAIKEFAMAQGDSKYNYSQDKNIND